MRSPDPEIPADEPLYRSICPSDVIEGDHVLPSAVDIPSMSCNRARYATAESVLVPERPKDTGVAAITPGDLPEPMRSPDPKKVVIYEFFAADDPGEFKGVYNDAHAEVRLRKQGEPYNHKLRISSAVFLSRLQAAVADCMHVVIQPT